VNNAKRTLEYVPDPNKFDLRTHVWDTQGTLVRKNPYRAHINDGRTLFERPVNSGNLWGENNQPAGRVELEFGPNGKISKKTFHFEAAHKAYTPPLSGAEALHYQLEQEKEKNAALQAEIDQIRSGKQPLSAVQEGFPAEKAEPVKPEKRR
jgi:hypothetical protein